MEIKIYLRILMRKWWIVVPTFLIALTATIVFTFTQTPTYQAFATFIVIPNASFPNVQSFVNGLEALGRRAEIATTYAEIANSRFIKQEAIAEIGLSSEQKRGISVDSRLVAGTNVIAITVEGQDADLVRDLANMVGTKTVVYVQDLYEVYDLKLLDQATDPLSPIKPNKPLNLALGAALGLALGIGIALLAEYLQTPLENVRIFDILDSETGVYNKRYLTQRLREEMSRANRNNYPLSLALMKIDYPDEIWTSLQTRSEALRKVAAFLRQYLRKEDILVRYDDAVFAFLLPDVVKEDAKITLEKLLTRMAWTSFEMERNVAKLNLTGTSGIVGYHHNGVAPDELLALANQALQQAELTDYGSAFLASEDGDPQ